MEIWDVYDRDRIRTGKTMVRGSDFEADAYHMVVHVCIFHSDGRMLIQQRQPFKEGWPNLWDITVGGSAVAGDSSQSAAEREVLEEIGYQINLQAVRPSLTINFEKGFDDIYLVEDDVEISSLKVPSEEVQKVKWATSEEIISMIHSGNFIPYHTSLIELLFDLRKGLGGHSKSAQ
ncbi:NUDIX hydrolase [Bacillus sp. B-jedd]|uniref:NUDIX hydrolase n=1 Tax=Bacillus sp. B-jedd TaxID=1476857 RepID=UPI0005156F09|nr:NUDIX domain-containing protein [Bacillus sp. B-jedd]CEG26406.1 NUDIX hydrolase [Bacillus sp. B-jedd]